MDISKENSQQIIQLPQTSLAQQQTEQNFIKDCFYTTKCTLKIADQIPGNVVHSLHLAYNLTFLVQNRYRKIQHYNINSELLYEQQFNKLIVSIYMVDSRSALILLRSMNQQADQIIQLNLQTYHKSCLHFRKQLKQIYGMEVFTQSQVFCIKQRTKTKSQNGHGLKSQQYTKLTYYPYPIDINADKQPIYKTYFSPKQFSFQDKYRVLKFNNRSMIGIVPLHAYDENKVDVFIYNPEANHKYWKKYLFPSNLKIKENNYLLKIVDAWECQPDTFYVKCQSFPHGQTFNVPYKKLDSQRILKTLEKSYDFLWKYKSGKKSVFQSKIVPNCIHKTYFKGQYFNLNLVRQLRQFIYKSRQIRAIGVQEYMWTDGIPDEQPIPTKQQLPIYFLQNLDKNECAMQKFQFDILKRKQKANFMHYKLISVPYSPNKFLKYNQELCEQNFINLIQIEIKKLKQLKYPQNIITAYLVTEIIQKVDDDLLFYIVEIVEMDEHQKIIY